MSEAGRQSFTDKAGSAMKVLIDANEIYALAYLFFNDIA